MTGTGGVVAFEVGAVVGADVALDVPDGVEVVQLASRDDYAHASEALRRDRRIDDRHPLPHGVDGDDSRAT